MNVGIIILAIGAALFLVGSYLTLLDWTNSNPEAPHGRPVVILAVIALGLGGMVSCGETLRDVRELKAANSFGCKHNYINAKGEDTGECG